MIDVGTVIADRYELQERLGVGGMGEVYRAYDRRFRLDVAIKALLPHVSRDEQLVERFLREGRTLALLRHPGIIGIFDMLHVDGHDLLVLEYVPGQSLEDELRGGRMPWSRCADIGAQVCGALAAAHARDVIHRDIKPSNILLEPSGVVRVADFGIARLATNVSSVTRAGMSMGTPGFWAPEQALGEKLTPQTDIYSLGAVLFLAGTGRLPFVAEEEGPATAYINVTRPVPDPREVAPDLPAAASDLIMRALSKDPAGRYPSATEMARALRLSAGLPLVPVTPFETPMPDPNELNAGPTEGDAPGGPAVVVPPTVHTGSRDVEGAPEAEAAATAPKTEVEPIAPVAQPSAPETEVEEAPEHVGARGAPETEIEGGAPETEVGPPTPAPETRVGGPRTPDGGGAATAPTGPVAAKGGARPSRGLVVAGAVVVVAAAVVGGLAAGGAFSGGESSEPVATTRVEAGTSTVALPEDWPAEAGGGSIPGIELANATTASPAGETGEQMSVGTTDAQGATLLPAALRQSLVGIPEAERVLLGRNQAYLYRDLEVEGYDGRVSVFAMPTTRGVATVDMRRARRPGGGVHPGLRVGCDDVAAGGRDPGSPPRPEPLLRQGRDGGDEPARPAAHRAENPAQQGDDPRRPGACSAAAVHGLRRGGGRAGRPGSRPGGRRPQRGGGERVARAGDGLRRHGRRRRGGRRRRLRRSAAGGRAGRDRARPGDQRPGGARLSRELTAAARRARARPGRVAPMPCSPRAPRLVLRALELLDATRPEPRALRAALDRRWAELPAHARFRAQSIGRRTAGCEGTHGVFPRCDLACTPCYHSREANRVRIDGDHTEREIDRQMAHLSSRRGPGQNAQLIGGEVTLLGPEAHARALAAMMRHGRKPMSMSHGDFGWDYLRALAVGPDGRPRFRELIFAAHFDSRMFGRRGAERPAGEPELDPFRRRFCAMFERLRAETGVRSYLAHNMTVTPANADQVPDVVRGERAWGGG